MQTKKRVASDRTRELFDAAVFERLDVKGGRLCHEQYRPPFDGVFNVSEFEYGTRVEVAGIEPASFSFASGLLRAQPVRGFSGLPLATGTGGRPQSARCPRWPADATTR